MQRSCAVCGSDYEALTSRSKFCGSSCRSKAHRGTALVAVESSSTPPASAASSSTLAALGAIGALEWSTRAVLEEARRDETPLGVAAITLARTIDDSQTPPAARGPLTKEFRATLAEATKGAATASSIDELRRRRAERRTG